MFKHTINSGILLALLTFTIFQEGCKKKSTAGFGGDANIRLFAKHHGDPIDSVTFYIKFNASDIPADGIYDIAQKAITYSVGNSYALLSGLKKGDYYIYALGWDPAISQYVKGGLPYSLTEETNLDLIISMTE